MALTTSLLLLCLSYSRNRKLSDPAEPCIKTMTRSNLFLVSMGNCRLVILDYAAIPEEITATYKLDGIFKASCSCSLIEDGIKIKA